MDLMCMIPKGCPRFKRVVAARSLFGNEVTRRVRSSKDGRRFVDLYSVVYVAQCGASFVRRYELPRGLSVGEATWRISEFITVEVPYAKAR